MLAQLESLDGRFQRASELATGRKQGITNGYAQTGKRGGGTGTAGRGLTGRLMRVDATAGVLTRKLQPITLGEWSPVNKVGLVASCGVL